MVSFCSKDHPPAKDAAELPCITNSQRGAQLPAPAFDSGLDSARQTELHFQLLFSSEQIRMFALHNHFLSLAGNEQQGWFCIRETHSAAGLCSTKPRAIKPGGFYSSRPFPLLLLKLLPPEREQVHGDITNRSCFLSCSPGTPPKLNICLLAGCPPQWFSMALGVSASLQQLKPAGMDLWLDFAVFGDAQSWFVVCFGFFFLPVLSHS